MSINRLSVACEALAAKRAEVKRTRFAGEVPPILKEKFAGKAYFVKTYGCQGNVRDGEAMAGRRSGRKPRQAIFGSALHL